MANETHYIAFTSLDCGCRWPFTRPKRSPQKAIYAAENQVSFALLVRLGLSDNSGSSNFGVWVRSEHPKVVTMANDYIGEVREVELLEGETPMQFRKRFCNVSYRDVATQANALGEAFV